ncbi:MAG: hypothetical protein WBF01_05550, partial [Candidatus Acidiferrum sp.]
GRARQFGREVTGKNACCMIPSPDSPARGTAEVHHRAAPAGEKTSERPRHLPSFLRLPLAIGRPLLWYLSA